MNSQILIKVNTFVKKRLIELFGCLLILISVFLLVSIATYSPSDPNFIYTAEGVKIKNFGGFYGSVVSDFLLQSMGLVAFFTTLNFFHWGLILITIKKISNFISKIFFTLIYIILGTTFANIFFNESFWLVENGNGGFVGRIIKENTYIFSNIIENQYAGFLMLFLSISFFILSLNLKIKEISIIILFPYFVIRKILIIFKGKKKITNNLDDANIDMESKNLSNDIVKNTQQILPFSKNKEPKFVSNNFKLPPINFLEKNPDFQNRKNTNNIELNKNSEFLFNSILLVFF